MRLIIIAHPNDKSKKKYLFKIPENELAFAGDTYICDTSHGKEYGIAVSNSILLTEDESEKLAKICEMFDTSPDKLRYIVGVVLEREFDIEEVAAHDN